MVTSQDVARLANVSQSTVSRCFRGEGYVNSKTRTKVLKAAGELGYYPDYFARGMKSKKSGIIGLILPDYNNIFFSTLMKSIETYLKQRGYRLMLAYHDEDEKKERECLEIMMSSRADGLFIVPAADTEANVDLYDTMQRNGVKIVQLIRRLHSDINTVMIDDEMGGYLAAKYLLDQGHRNIVITEYGFNEKAPTKTMGFLRAYREKGEDTKNAHIIDLPFSVDLTAIIAGAIMSNKATAIITSNIPITINALEACKRQNLSVPDDISLIAYDDSPWLDLLNITAIAHPMSDIGKDMANMMLSMLDGITEEKEKPEVGQSLIAIKPYLVLRGSVKTLK